MTKTFLAAFSGLFFLMVQGCGGMANYAGQQKHPYDVAVESFQACTASIDTSAMAGKPNYILNNLQDPDRLAKLTSQEPIQQDYKDFILVFDTQFMRCSQNFMADISRIDSRLVANWADYSTSRTKNLTDILEGRILTYGELNKRIEADMSRYDQRERQIGAAMNQEAQQRNAELEAQRQQQAQIAWQNYQNSMNQSNQAMNRYLDSLNRQMEYESLNRMRQTNCRWIGSTLNCTTF